MAHILERHHPKYWNGTLTDKQDFFSGRVTVDDINDLISRVLNQNRDKILRGETSLEGIVDGKVYKLGLDWNGGRIGNFHPY